MPQRPLHVSQTVLIYGEGPQDRAFLSYLNNTYADDAVSRTVTVRCGHGGSCIDLVIGAHRLLGDFNKKVVKLDGDRDELVEALNLAVTYGIIVVVSTPCIEAMLLEILEPNRGWRNQLTSRPCKRRFEHEYIARRRRTDARAYGLFTKDILDEARQRVSELNELIGWMTDASLV